MIRNYAKRSQPFRSIFSRSTKRNNIKITGLVFFHTVCVGKGETKIKLKCSLLDNVTLKTKQGNCRSKCFLVYIKLNACLFIHLCPSYNGPQNNI